MKKDLLLVSIIFTILGIINGTIYTILACLNIVESNIKCYLLIALFLLAVWVPVFIQLIFKKIDIHIGLVIAFDVFIVMSVAVGSLWGVYEISSIYDKIVHFSTGILFPLLGYNLFNNRKDNYVNLIWLFIIVFSFSMMIGALWEVCEFTIDFLPGMNSQRWLGFEGRGVLMDTMIDVICDTMGSLIGASIVLFIHKQNHQNKLMLELKS